ncbi:hypothetical protein EBR96_03545 [bacterium]|nr:hypothetical protein [bacterium]
MKQIRFIDPMGAARAAALINFVLSAAYLIPSAILSRGSSASGVHVSKSGIIWAFKVLTVTPLMMFFAALIAAWTYNRYAAKFGGIEVDIC